MKIVNLTLSYEDKKVIENLNLEIGDGITCLIGENGKGKTTLLKYIAGLLKEENGQIIEGPLRPSICFQEDRLFENMTVLENLEAVSEDKEVIKRIIHELDLEELLETEVKILSGGQKRRAAIGRALVYNGDYLLLDEPMKGIDEENSKKILDVLTKVKVPVLMVTHNIKEAEYLHADIISL